MADCRRIPGCWKVLKRGEADKGPDFRGGVGGKEEQVGGRQGVVVDHVQRRHERLRRRLGHETHCRFSYPRALWGSECRDNID
jgi:hypothetical protein